MINNDCFLEKEIPRFHAITQKYDRLQYWREQKRRIIEGYWVGGKWMPPELYYYVNFHTITFEDGAFMGTGRPWLRDLEFEKAYIWTEACGFSGFTGDSLHTCHRWYGPEKDKALKYGWITKEELSKKIYVPAREYLQRIHPGNLGKPLYLNEAKHIIDLESRGGGKSFWASGCIVHNYITDGARDYDEYLSKTKAGNPMKSEGFVGSINQIYSDNLIDKVKVAFEYLPDKQVINTGKEFEVFPSPLSKAWTGSLAASKKITAVTSGSIIHHRTFGDNPLAANGTRPNRVWIDEVGFMHNIKQAWEGTEATQASMQHKRLVIHAMGTGGLTSGGAALYTQEIFYDPEAYGCLSFDDIWEGRGKIGYFVPGTKTLNQFKETDNYITNEDKALDYVLTEREDAKKAKSGTKLMGVIINKPIVPSEIFLRAEGTYFPVAELKSRLADIESRESLLSASYRYDFNMYQGKVTPSVSMKKPIRDYPLIRGAEMDSCVELYELPKRDSQDNIPTGRYIAGWDPVSTDGNENAERSLQSCFIMDSWTGKIVAEYSARTYLHEDYYEQVRRLLMFYNARCNYENNIKGPYAYFKNKNSLHLLCETPDILKDMSLVSSSAKIGNTSLGTHATQEVVSWGLSLIKSWLEEQAYNESEDVRNIDKLMSPALIKELISYNPDVNVDRISALVMLMIFREDRRKYTEFAKKESVKKKSSDKFWNKAFYGNNRYTMNALRFEKEFNK